MESVYLSVHIFSCYLQFRKSMYVQQHKAIKCEVVCLFLNCKEILVCLGKPQMVIALQPDLLI